MSFSSSSGDQRPLLTFCWLQQEWWPILYNLIWMMFGLCKNWRLLHSLHLKVRRRGSTEWWYGDTENTNGVQVFKGRAPGNIFHLTLKRHFIGLCSLRVNFFYVELYYVNPCNHVFTYPSFHSFKIFPPPPPLFFSVFKIYNLIYIRILLKNQVE